MLFRVAMRNLLVHRWKSLLVGSFLIFGTTLVIVGNSLLDAIDHSMATSIVHSVAGHLQVYSEDAKDELSIFGRFDGSPSDLGVMNNFTQVRTTLEKLENVKTVVPMGMDTAVISTSNVFEQRLSLLRGAVNTGDVEAIAVQRDHLEKMVDTLQEQLKNMGEIANMDRIKEEEAEKIQALEEVRQPDFWSRFDADPLGTLEFLENKIAPLALDGDLVWIAYIGTHPGIFQQTFDRFEIVQGEPIPSTCPDGTLHACTQRGFLFNQRVYEERIKHKHARRLDQIRDALAEGETIEDCEDCQTWIRQNVSQAPTLAYRFDRAAAKRVTEALQDGLRTSEEDLGKLLKTLFTMNDDNFSRGYDLFYEEVAPHIMLYSIPIGSTLHLTGFGRGGYPRTIAVKVYGSFRFKSLDESPIAGGFNLIDMISFRDLYGYMTDERREEITAIRKESGVKEIDREDAEAALFGEDSTLVEDSASIPIEETAGIQMDDVLRYNEETQRRVYGREEIERGVVLNAAVMLYDGDQSDATMSAIKALNESEGLGIQVIGWREASGLVGEFIGVVRAVLYGAVGIIFLVALLIINNSLMMSILERTREIGTLRAIGAQRAFVRKMIAIETVVLAVVFGALGALIGSGIVLIAGYVGIPAWNKVTVFLFAGSRLHPSLMPEHIGIAILAIVFVSIVSTLYPVFLATRVTPLVAMQAED